MHHFADLVRLRHGFTPPKGEEGWKFIHDGRAMWEERDRLLNSEAGSLDPEIEQRIRTDLLELAVVWADLRVRLASKADVDQARREAILVLDQAEASCGPSPSLNRERRAYARAWDSPSHLLALIPRLGPPGSTMTWDGLTSAQDWFRRRPRSFGARSSLSLKTSGPTSTRATARMIWDSSRMPRPPFAPASRSRPRPPGVTMTGRGPRRSWGRSSKPSMITAAPSSWILHWPPQRSTGEFSLTRPAGLKMPSLIFSGKLRAGPDPETVGRIHYNLALAHLARGDRKAALASAEEAVTSGYQKARDFRDGLRRRP